MRKVIDFLTAVRRDGPIIGFAPYLMYRYRAFRKNKQPMLVTVAGQSVLVRPATPDLRVAFQSLRHEFDILENVLSPNFSGIIVDAGGYIGSTALKLSAIYPEATIVAIEPSDENFAILKRNVEDNPNIFAINAALYTEGSKSMPLKDRGTGNWGFSIAVHDSADVTGDLGIVETISLDDILLKFPGKSIGLIKLDIEGGEYSLFENPSSAMRDIPAVFVELHDRIVPGCTDVFMKFSAERWVVNAGGEKLLSLKGKPEEKAASFG